jgi:hypothetical protein
MKSSPARPGRSTQEAANPELEPDRVEEKTGEDKIWLTRRVNQATRLTS